VGQKAPKASKKTTLKSQSSKENMVSRGPKKPNSPRIAVFEHALPHRILLEELKAQVTNSPKDVAAFAKAAEAVANVEAAYGRLEAAKDALDDWSTAHSGLPALGSEQQAEQNRELEKVRQAEWNCKASAKGLTDELHRADRSALCFSGGGIRSASICLGVLQGLARFSTRDPAEKPGMLHKFNFLSTVSGGGYIGSWLMAWARRHPRGFTGVVDEISKCGSTGVDPEPRPLRHLREYTSFLAPRLGGLTVDTWTLLATVMRNLFLNNCMLLPAAAALLCLPILVGSAMDRLSLNLPSHNWIAALALSLSVALLLLTLVQNVSKQWKWQKTAQSLLFVANGTIGFAVAGLVIYWMVAQLPRSTIVIDATQFLTFVYLSAIPLLVPALYGSWMISRKARNWRDGLIHRLLFVFAVPVVALATSTLLLLLAQIAPTLEQALRSTPHFAARLHLTEDLWPKEASVYVLGLPLVWATLLTVSSLFTGVVAKSDLEENREWWARMKAIHMMMMLGWFVASLLAFYGPALFNWVVGMLTLGAGAISAFTGKSASTSAQVGKVVKSRLNLIAPLFGLLFLFLLAITLAAVNHGLINLLKTQWPCLGEGETWAIYAAALGGFAIFCNLFFSVNTFSLHSMYRSRLMRAYLGASNEFRSPDFFTNFDEDDNLKECDLLLGSDGPLHIINATLNLVATTNTAWTQRKAESFTFSPLHCGSFRVGYVPTRAYAGRDGMTLATAMAISGAAFNPNMGYHSSPLLALIMTLFNVRLGYWLPNPRLDKSARFFLNSSPRLALVPLVSEALGNTNDTVNFIQVSDGGHFENLALYEMVMRRCHRIVVVDGGADPKFEFEDLGNAVRKIRIDLGIQVEFRSDNHIQSGNNPQAVYCAIADIHYREIDGENAKDGELIYLKPAVRHSEAIDVQNYASTHPNFPNQTTADQFFNESQFESHRKLGTTMVQEIMECAPKHAFTTTDFFTAAKQYSEAAAFLPVSTERVVSEVSTFLESGKMRVTLGST
jgi:hypothetical protein